MIQGLTIKVKKLYMGRSNLNQKVDAILYYRNMTNDKALPTIEDNFFRSPLTDKKRKGTIFNCLKISMMKYIFSLVNGTALATAKRAYSKLLNNPEILPENNNIVFAHTMRINLAEKATQIFEPDTEPLFKPQAFNSLVAAKNSTRRTATSPTALSNNPAPKNLPSANNQKVFAGGVAAEQKGIKLFSINSGGMLWKNNPHLTTIRLKTHKNITDILTEICKIYKKSIGNVNSSSPKPINSETSFTAQEQRTSKIEYTYINICSYRAGNTELNILENSIKNMKQITPSEALMNIDFKELLTILYAAQLRSFVGRSMQIYLNNTTTLLCVNCTNGMVNVRSNIYTVIQAIRESQYRYICISKQHKNTKILQLVLRPKGSRTKCVSTQLEIVGKSIIMVSRSTETFYPTTTTSTSNHSDYGFKKLKFKLSKNSTESTSAAQIFATNSNRTIESSNIHQIDDVLMAYREYKYIVATTPYITPHINSSSWMVNRLLRQVNRHENPLSVDSIIRYIHSLSGLITRPKDTPIPKDRAIGATLAAQAGESADNIVNHSSGLII
ncbi:hypothetical protein BB561_005423 [Smittium simulii]|uniref:Uncharacterized protein n=1 Tax=Smittium simulii TaxID=133385 RepID=A0A2T9YAG0_9FUNG|nr:hypothetical protein BB561_005423 [Smittium simulii]